MRFQAKAGRCWTWRGRRGKPAQSVRDALDVICSSDRGKPSSDPVAVVTANAKSTLQGCRVRPARQHALANTRKFDSFNRGKHGS